MYFARAVDTSHVLCTCSVYCASVHALTVYTVCAPLDLLTAYNAHACALFFVHQVHREVNVHHTARANSSVGSGGRAVHSIHQAHS